MEDVSTSGASKGFHHFGSDAGSPGPCQINTAQLDGFIDPEDSAKSIQGNSFDRLSFHLPEIPSVSETLADQIFAELPPELPQIPKVAGSFTCELRHLFAEADETDSRLLSDMGYLSNIISVGETKRAVETLRPSSHSSHKPVSSALLSHEAETESSLLNIASEHKYRNTAEQGLECLQEVERYETTAFIKDESPAAYEKEQGTEVPDVSASASIDASNHGVMIPYRRPTSTTTSSPSIETFSAQSAPTTPGSPSENKSGRIAHPSVHGKPGAAEVLLQKLGQIKKLKADIALGVRQYNGLQAFCAQLRNAGAYLVQNCTELHRQNEALRTDIAGMRNEGAYLMQNFSRLQAQNEELSGDNQALRGVILSLQAENHDLAGHVENYRGALQNTQAVHAECIKESQALRREIADRTSQHADLARRQRIKHGRRVIGLRLQVDRVERRAQDLEDALVEERSDRDEEQEALAEEVAGLRKSLTDLEAQLPVQEDSRSDDGADKSSEYEDAMEYQTTKRWTFLVWLRKPLTGWFS